MKCLCQLDGDLWTLVVNFILSSTGAGKEGCKFISERETQWHGLMKLAARIKTS